jgi:hypothetical protein
VVPRILELEFKGKDLWDDPEQEFNQILKNIFIIIIIITITMRHPPSAKFGTNFADKRRLLCRYGSLVDSGH